MTTTHRAPSEDGAPRVPGSEAGPRPLPRSVHAWYGTGAVALGVFNTVPGLLLLIYLTDTLAVSPALAGAVIFLPKLIDLLVSPYIGIWSDRTRSSWGPRRPWMLAGALTLPLLFAAVFAGPPLQGAGAAAYVAALFVLAALASSMFVVPYTAMPGEITSDYHERSTFNTWRTAFAGLALLLGGALAPVIQNVPEDPVTGYRLMGLFMGAVLVLSMLGTVVGTRRAPRPAFRPRSEGLLAQLRVAFAHRHFRVLFPANLLMAVASGTMVAGVPYVTANIMGEPAYTSILMVCVLVPLMAAAPLWKWLSLRVDKKRAAACSAAVFALGGLGLLLIPLWGVPGAVFSSVLVGVGLSGTMMLPASMLADCMAAEDGSGRRQGGVLSGVWTSGEAMAQAVGTGLLSLSLALSGYVESGAGEVVQQSGTALRGMLIGSTLLPAAVMVCCLVPLMFYRLRDPGAGPRK
ncbi:MFS transporter [Nocardiopsis metallicus]|uniref:GPH family glycoside/pentoside/hexuronide:cation symporter n=1 Tax=Nocardiopsis metallicus TaxID=179819 RepID=A0A840WYY1_9ACTN|nr:GPH family glycoside/pentoside/hexuronide:cation symporter [Nocardiopsis metallicus]